MLKWLWIVPLLIAAGCSKGNVATSQGTVGYAQPAGNPEPVAPPEAAPPPPMNAPTNTPVNPGVGAVLPSGTPLHVRVDESIDTRRNRAGDGFTATLSEPIEVGGRVLVPAGTPFHGHVTAARASGRLKGRAEIGLALDGFQLNGREYRVSTTSVDRVSANHKKRNAWLIGGATGLGTALGAIAGGPKGALIGAGAGAGAGTAGAAITGKKQVGVRAEASLRFTLREDVAL
jgi:hypothetical protein